VGGSLVWECLCFLCGNDEVDPQCRASDNKKLLREKLKMSNRDETKAQETQPHIPATAVGQTPDTDCTIPVPTMTVDTAVPTVQKVRTKRSTNKKGTGGLDSLGGGKLP
jgi:hypothetical protein